MSIPIDEALAAARISVRRSAYIGGAAAVGAALGVSPNALANLAAGVAIGILNFIPLVRSLLRVRGMKGKEAVRAIRIGWGLRLAIIVGALFVVTRWIRVDPALVLLGIFMPELVFATVIVKSFLKSPGRRAGGPIPREGDEP